LDDIQRKLALIDAQLTASPLTSYKRTIATCPLVFPAIGLIFGILMQSKLLGPRTTGDEPRFLWFWLILLTFSVIAAVLIFALATKARLGLFSVVLLSFSALICFTCLGAVRLIAFCQPKPNDIRNFVADQRILATIRGLIVTKPYIEKRQWQFAKFKPTDPSSSFYLKIREVQTTQGWANVTGTVRVQVDEPVLDLKANDYIQAYCWLDRFKEPTNPGQFNIARYLARKNIFISASVKSRDGIELRETSAGGAITKLKTQFTETATQALVGNLSPEDRNRALLEALLLGYRGSIDSSTYRAFRETGLLHFISLSGMHLGILIGFVWSLCKLAGLVKRARAIVCIIAICLFLLVVPPRAPTVRAAIIGFVFCASLLFRRRPNSLNTLSLAAIILLLIRPTQLFEAGWQLSFASVLGILLFADRIHFFLRERFAIPPLPKKAAQTDLLWRIISKVCAYASGLFSIGLAAWLGGAGILLYHFYTIDPLTSIWTIVAFPFVALILTVGYLKIILSLILPTAAAFLGAIVTGLAACLIWLVEHIAALGLSQILIGHVPLALVVLYYCLVLFAGAAFRHPLVKKLICTATLVVIVAFLGVTKWQRTYRDTLVLTCLDVGHGQAILAQMPGKANYLFDAGSWYKSNVGQRIVAPFLDYIGISKIDAVIISHNDTDHINGIPEIVEHCKVRNVYVNDAFFRETDPWPTAAFLDKSLRQRGIEVRTVKKDFNLAGSDHVRILWPSKEIPEYQRLSDNDTSLVLLIEFGGKKILLPSDIEKFAQQELLRMFPNLKADVLLVPHHGSANTMAADFLEKINADVLIYSCSRRSYERQQIINPTNNAKTFYTPKDGAVTVHVDKGGAMRIITFKSQNKTPAERGFLHE